MARIIKVNYKDKVFEVEEGISALDFIKNNTKNC